jgi:hypothetical protein
LGVIALVRVLGLNTGPVVYGGAFAVAARAFLAIRLDRKLLFSDLMVGTVIVIAIAGVATAHGW